MDEVLIVQTLRFGYTLTWMHLDTVNKDESWFNVNDLNPSKFYLGQIPRYPGQCKYDAHSVSCIKALDTIRRGSNRKELTWIKTNTEKRVNKVLRGQILISFNVQLLTR